MSNLHEHKKEVIEKLKIQENIQIDKKICLSEENFKETQTNSLIKTEFEDPIETDENKTEIKEEKKSYIPKVLMQEIQSSKSSKSSADLCIVQ